jgi:hypothetical protein
MPPKYPKSYPSTRFYMCSLFLYLQMKFIQFSFYILFYFFATRLFLTLIRYHSALFAKNHTNSQMTDELICERERYAEIGDDLDFAFVDLIEGIEPIYTNRRPKPKTPPPEPPKPVVAAAPAGGEGGVAGEAGVAGAEGAAGADGQPAGPPAKPKSPSPFFLPRHLPPDIAEVPFVKNWSPEPLPANREPWYPPEEAAPASTPAPAEGAPAAEGEAIAAEAPAADAPAAEAPAAEAAPEAPAS